MAELRVADTGIGVPADKLEAIFEPFVQVGRSLNSPGEGTRLGLAISRDLARGMRGDITVASTLGAGSTFTSRCRPHSADQALGGADHQVPVEGATRLDTICGPDMIGGPGPRAVLRASGHAAGSPVLSRRSS
jgi:hypothetical protein